MKQPQTLEIAHLCEHFGSDAIAFLGRSSFEERCFSTYIALEKCNFLHKHFFYSQEETEVSRELRAKNLDDKCSQSVINTRDPLKAKRIIENQVEIISDIFSSSPFSLVIDITSFRREELLILLKALGTLREEALADTSFVYTIASRMGNWLSNNVRQIRPVIGYPGEMMSRRGTHLVILAGIEHERAIAIIEAYEPKNISLGTVPSKDSVSESIHMRNKWLGDYLVRHFDNVTTKFDFSAKDPLSVILTLKSITAKRPGLNTVIAPLNTKLSTIGCGVFALLHQEVQLCYAEVDVYNASGYSMPGDQVVVVRYSDLIAGV